MFYRAKIVCNQDPRGLQRVQVRINGIHNLDTTELPDDILPWAKPTLPITMGKVDGGYGKFEVPDVGDWVWVFFEESDSQKQTPFYFGIIRGEIDNNSNYKQGENKYTHDRWDNMSVTDHDHYEKIDTWKNRILINKDLEQYTDHFGNQITMNEEKIEIKSQNGNLIIMNSNNNEIKIKTPSKGLIEIKDDYSINIEVGSSGIILNSGGDITVSTWRGKNETFDFYKTMMLFNTHTHMLGYATTTPPTSFMNIFNHTYPTFSFFGNIPKNNLKIDKDTEFVAEDDVPGTIYNEDSIHPNSPTPEDPESEVASTLLMNGNTNPSTDEFEGVVMSPSIPPKYTGEIIEIEKDGELIKEFDFYKKGKKIGSGELVIIQGKAVEKRMGEKIYEMIKKSQIYNMVEVLKLLEEEDLGVYKVTEEGAKVLDKDEDDLFIFTEEYHNNECPYSLVVVNSGFRSHIEDIQDNHGVIVARSQLSMRQRFRKNPQMTEEQLMTASARDFSPFVAKPGYSKHQNGTAVDFNTRGAGGKQGEWLKKNADEFGFKGGTVPSEPWHYEFEG